MKKIYTLALAALCTLGAAAVAPEMADFNEKLQYSPRTHATVTITGETVNKVIPTSMLKAPAKAQAIDGLDALNLWSRYGLLEDASGEMASAVIITVDNATTGEVTIQLSQSFFVKGTYDAAAGTLTIKQQVIAKDKSGNDVYFYVKGIDKFDNLIDGAAYDETVGIYDGTTVTFAEDEIWAIGYPENEIGWYVLSAENVFEYEKPLTYVGTCSYVDNIVYKTFTGADNDKAYEYEVYTNDEGMYLIPNALQALYATMGIEDDSPAMILDATDPTNVQIPICETGLINNQTDKYPFVYFSESFYSAVTGEELDPAFVITKVTDGNKVTFTIPYHSIIVMLSAGENTKYYYSANVETVITFTEDTAGVDNVIENSNNAPVEYYNLQGMRVENPVSGQLLIKKQGTKATKVLVK